MTTSASNSSFTCVPRLSLIQGDVKFCLNYGKGNRGSNAWIHGLFCWLRLCKGFGRIVIDCGIKPMVLDFSKTNERQLWRISEAWKMMTWAKFHYHTPCTHFASSNYRISPGFSLLGMDFPRHGRLLHREVKEAMDYELLLGRLMRDIERKSKAKSLLTIFFIYPISKFFGKFGRLYSSSLDHRMSSENRCLKLRLHLLIVPAP